MTTVKQAYIDALLADAAYVDVTPGMDVAKLTNALSKSMTPTLAAYIAANFEVASSINTSDIPLVGSGFDATVWRIRSGSELAGSNNENAGRTYVSMRGTESPPDAAGADLLADGDLTLGSAAASAIVDMVNWWLRETTPTAELARQITILKLKADPAEHAQGVAGNVIALDLAVDAGDLVVDGLAWSQIVDMYNYWKELTTPAGQSYQKASLVESFFPPGSGGFIVDNAPLIPGTKYWQIQLTDASSPTGPKVPAGAPLEVTGHSLGGHLASAFTRLFSGVASQAYTINARGHFGTRKQASNNTHWRVEA